MEERGLHVDHSTIQRWVFNYSPQLEQAFRKRKKPVSKSWRLDETYIKVKGQWKYLYRAVDKQGLTIDFMLSAKRDTKAAKKFFKKAIKSNGTPATVNIDKSGANNAGIKAYNRDFLYKVKIRQSKYLNNIVESDHRKIKTITNPMKGFQSFKTARIVLWLTTV